MKKPGMYVDRFDDPFIIVNEEEVWYWDLGEWHLTTLPVLWTNTPIDLIINDELVWEF
jgi:hypothetical protein